jgi:hypothetical protein
MEKQTNSLNIDQAGALHYEMSMHRVGRIWTGIMILVMSAIPFIYCLIFKTWFNFSSDFWRAFLPIVMIYLPSGIIEVIAYSPLLGVGGTYLAFITGNLVNLKIPCAMNARRVANTELNSKEGELVSTISLAVSAIVTTITLAIGVILITPLAPLLESPVLMPAFKCVIPAMFGALGYKYVKDSPKLAVVPFTLAIVLFLAMPGLTNSMSIMTFVIAALSILSVLLAKKLGWL